MKLFEIVDELKKIEKMIEGNGGEVNEAHEQLISELTFTLQEKTDGCVLYLKQLEDEIKNAQNLKKEMDEFIASRNKTIESFKKYIQICMHKLNAEKFVGGIYSIKERSPSKVLKIDFEDNIPDAFFKRTKTVKNKELLARLKEGYEIEGVKIVDGQRSLKIGIKSKKD